MKIFDAVRLALTTRLSDRDIAAALSVSKTTVRRYRRIAATRGYTWSELGAMTPGALRAKFNRQNRGASRKRLPEFAVVKEELSSDGVTLQLLWEEYRAAGPEDALSYAQFTARYRKYLGQLPSSMRQSHPAGERVFVDFSGRRPAYVDQATRERVPVELFVAVLGASNYLYATCVPSQTVPDWIHVHAGMLAFFGGTPQVIVPDNLKSGVIKPGASGIAPTLQRTYADFARHYDVAIVPARPFRPRDKAKVELGVKLAQRWILARLRHHSFFSLDDLNRAVGALVVEFNERPFKRLPGNRRQRFETTDRPALKPLPPEPYMYAEWRSKQTVPKDYHVPIDGHFYSVPHAFVGQSVETRITRDAVEFFVNHSAVARHPRSPVVGDHTTTPDHQPEAHRAYAGRTPERMRAWAKSVGPNTLRLVDAQFARAKPVLGLPMCSALKRLAEKHGEKTLESAARRAVALRSLTLTSIKSILRNGLHLEEPKSKSAPTHANLRGASYYTEGQTC
jgi:transposase